MNNSGLGGCLFINNISPDPDDVDTINITLVDPITLADVEKVAGILHVDGNIHVRFSSNIIPGNVYYLKLNHRNSIETWSSNPVLFSYTTNYDFTTSASKAYGNNQSDLGDGNFAFFSGDISDGATATVGIQDGVIESQDFGDMENAVYITYLGYTVEDITGDGIVESADYGLMENNVFFTRVIIHP
jgi:hypothetical protein